MYDEYLNPVTFCMLYSRVWSISVTFVELWSVTQWHGSLLPPASFASFSLSLFLSLPVFLLRNSRWLTRFTLTMKNLHEKGDVPNASLQHISPPLPLYLTRAVIIYSKHSYACPWPVRFVLEIQATQSFQLSQNYFSSVLKGTWVWPWRFVKLTVVIIQWKCPWTIRPHGDYLFISRVRI